LAIPALFWVACKRFRGLVSQLKPAIHASLENGLLAWRRFNQGSSSEFNLVSCFNIPATPAKSQPIHRGDISLRCLIRSSVAAKTATVLS
jgi:hypothetical protein